MAIWTFKYWFYNIIMYAFNLYHTNLVENQTKFIWPILILLIILLCGEYLLVHFSILISYQLLGDNILFVVVHRVDVTAQPRVS